MTRIELVAAGMLAFAGCGVDGVEAIPDGLVVEMQTRDVVSGTFGQGGDGRRFDVSDLHGTHEAILCDAGGATLEDVVFVDGGLDGTSFIEATLLDRLWVIGIAGEAEPHLSGDPSMLAALAARREMQLVAPLQAALSAAGVAREQSGPTIFAPFTVDLYVTDGSAWSWSTLQFAALSHADLARR